MTANETPNKMNQNGTSGTAQGQSPPQQPQQQVPRALLLCQSNSHHFEQRTLALDFPMKIGRLVPRAQVATNNAIFDCKVLSRNHALIWYEDGMFFLKDTLSSNGTFVNNCRLVNDDRFQIFSNDLVQFGVDVLENNKKVTHGCIIATLRLYGADGREAVRHSNALIIPNGTQGLNNSGNLNSPNTVIPMEDLVVLQQIIQEALQREHGLEMKLRQLQNGVDGARNSADTNWQMRVSEARLLCRISTLEKRLQNTQQKACNKCNNNNNSTDGNGGQDDRGENIQQVFETYQIETVDKLENLHAEILRANGIATEQERCRAKAEQELDMVRTQYLHTQQILEELVQKFTEEQKNYRCLKQKYEEHMGKRLDLIGQEEMDPNIGGYQLADEHNYTKVNSNQDETDPKSDAIITLMTDEEEEAVKSFLKVIEDVGDELEKEELAEKGSLSTEKTLKTQYESLKSESANRIKHLEETINSLEYSMGQMENDLQQQIDLTKGHLAEIVLLKDMLVVNEQNYKDTLNENTKLRGMEQFQMQDGMILLEQEILDLKEKLCGFNEDRDKWRRSFQDLNEKYVNLSNTTAMPIHYQQFFVIVTILLLIIAYFFNFITISYTSAS